MEGRRTATRRPVRPHQVKQVIALSAVEEIRLIALAEQAVIAAAARHVVVAVARVDEIVAVVDGGGYIIAVAAKDGVIV